MIKYKIEKYSNIPGGHLVTFRKIVSKKELNSYLKNEWFVVEKIVPFKTWWSKFSIGNKIAIIAFVVPVIFGGIYFGLEKYLDNKYNSLNHNYNKLKSEQDVLNEQKLISSDSLNKLNKIIDTISIKQKTTKESDKKKPD
jgi:hypothetical protein